MKTSKIEWTEATWNPVTGCNKISVGCQHCYAEVMTRRLQAMGVDKYQNGFKVTTHEDVLNQPYLWKQSRIIFVNSMSDLFHKDVPLSFIKKVFEVMNNNPQHTFQVLTKRSDRLKKVAHELIWTENIWMGVSVENEDVIFRINDLVSTPAHIKFLSVEPLLGPIPNIPYLSRLNWIIVGGESGHGARPILEEWVVDIKNQCETYDVPFFFKQWGGFNKKKNGRLLDGRTWDEMPKIDQLSKESLALCA